MMDLQSLLNSLHQCSTWASSLHSSLILLVALAVLTHIWWKGDWREKSCGEEFLWLCSRDEHCWDNLEGWGQVRPPVWDGASSSNRHQSPFACSGFQV